MTKAIRLIISVLIPVVLFTQQQHTIRGTVTNSQTGKPVENANVSIVGTNEGATTKENGDFSISTFHDYPIDILVEHIAYSKHESTISDSRSLRISLWPTTLELDPVDVSVIRLPSHYDVSSAKDVLDVTELRTRGIQDFQELTRSMSSVVVQSGSNGSQTVSVRGSNANETPVYLDGVRINDSFTNTADMAQVNMDDIESVEVIKGASTLPYEAGAFGGVINIYSITPTQNKLLISNSADINDGKSSTRSAQASYVNRIFSANAQLSQRKRDITTFFSKTQTEHLFGSGALRFNLDRGNFYLKASSQESQTQQTADSEFETNSKNQLLNLRYTGSIPWLGPNWQLDNTYNQSEFGVSFWALGTNNPNYSQSPSGNTSAYRVAKLITHGQFENLIQYSGGIEEYFGPSKTAIPPIFEKTSDLTLDRETNSFTSISKFNVKNDNTYINLLSFEFGLRYDDVQTNYELNETRLYFNEGETEPRQTVYVEDENSNTHYLMAKRLGLRLEGAIQKFSYITYFSLGNNNRLPTLQDEFFRQTTTVPIYEDQEMFRETVNTVDMGVDFIYYTRPGSPFSQIDGSINYFDNGYINKLNYKYTPGQPPIPYNTLSASISGIELSGKFHFPSKRGILDIGSIFLNLSDPVVFMGKPKYRHTAGLTLYAAEFTFGANVWLDGAKFYLYDDGYYVPPNSNLDLSIDKEMTWDHLVLTTTLSAKNLFNLKESRQSMLVSDEGYLITFYDDFQLMLNFRASIF